jgi:hypothetical protein
VAHGTKVAVNLANSQAAANYPMKATITASNAATVMDGLTISCGGKSVNLSYINGSASQYTIPGGTQALSDSIVTSGAPIGTMKPDGNVWGCWDQRVWLGLKVQVKSVPEVPQSSGSCKAVDMVVGDNRTVSVTVNGLTSDNASITGYRVDWGDGSTGNSQTDSHTYAKDGTYTITSSVQVKFADGHSEWLTAPACTKQVTFKSGVPVTPPTTLINTGPGDVAAIFAATTLAGAMAYRLYMARRLARQ